MRHLSRVVWSEGMYLGPHHFQAQSRYFEDTIRFATAALWYEAYGIAGCRLNAEALRNDSLELLDAWGVFPDGLPFHIPASDPAPETRNLREAFPTLQDSVTVHLAVPQRVQDGFNCLVPDGDRGLPPSGRAPRFTAEERVLRDETTGRDEKPVQVGRKNLSLRLETELGPDDLSMPIARVRRDGSGHFGLDPEFIPPCLRLSASERLLGLLHRLVDILDDKAVSLAKGKQGRSHTEYSTREIAAFWMLHTIHASLVPLRHLLKTKRGHPEELYQELARLGGALCTFALDSHPRDLPAYDHLRLTETFRDLDRHIRTHLETLLPTNCIPITLRKTTDFFYAGEVVDQRCLDRAQWVLGVQSRIGEVELIRRTPQLVKVCSALFVPRLVERALPGMALMHLSIPPSAISREVGAQYFSIDRVGPCWDHLVATRQVGIYVPGDIPEPTLELLVVLES